MTRSPLRYVFALLTMSGAAVLALPACEKKAPPPPIEIPPPPPPADAGVVQITPFDDSLDSGTDAPPGKSHGGGGTPSNNNAARIRQCCNAIRHQATNLGAAPEATMMMGVAVQCDMVAAQVAGGAAPEFGQVRNMLKGRTLPAACAGM